MSETKTRGAKRKKRKSGGRASRRKGHDFEREIVRRFRDVFGNGVRRGWQARSGEEASDVVVPCFWVECKREKRTNPKAALRQAMDDATKGKMPIAVCKDDRRDPIVAMQFEDFLELVREWWELSQQ